MDGYWAYELCVGAHAWQHHTAAPGEPHPGPRHHIGEYRGTGAGRGAGGSLILHYDGGDEGRHAEVHVVCSWTPALLHVTEPRPLFYRLLLGAPAACGANGDDVGLSTSAEIGVLWGTCLQYQPRDAARPATPDARRTPRAAARAERTAGPEARAGEARLVEARALLGVHRSASAEQLRAAFLEHALRVPAEALVAPAGAPAARGGAALASLRRAYDLLINDAPPHPPPS